MSLLRISQLAPGIFRDGRPFADDADESRATGHLVPPPSTVAGFVRTTIGRHLGWNWNDPAVVRQAQALAVHGYVFTRVEESALDGSETEVPVLPAPADAVVFGTGPYAEPQVMRLRPAALSAGEGCNLPAGVMLPVQVSADVKPERGYDWWTWPDLVSWLSGQDRVPARVDAPGIDERTHVGLDSGKRAALSGALFVVEYRSWDLVPNEQKPQLHTWRIRARIDDDPSLPRALMLGHLGGERRPAAVEPVTAALLPPPPAELVTALTTTRRVRMQLLTPAAFDDGWRPGWLTSGADGPWQDLMAAGPRLVSACVGRLQTVSGWSYETATRGPKTGVRLAPAGSTYVFDLDRPLTAPEIDNLWLAIVSDQDHHRREGFGLTVWGVCP